MYKKIMVLANLKENNKMKHILHCKKCGKYNLSNKCGCGGKAIENKPPKYSPEDKYGAYRRKVKEKSWKKTGYL